MLVKMTTAELVKALNEIEHGLDALPCTERPERISLNTEALHEFLVYGLHTETGAGIRAFKILAPHLWHGP